MSAHKGEWRAYSTHLDVHPESGSDFEKSEATLGDGYEWCGEWEPFSAVSDGKFYGGSDGGYQTAWVLWKRPCKRVY